jgi:hypothetical protein
MWRFFLLALCIAPVSLEAATIRVVPDVVPVLVGTPVTLTIYADIGDEVANAVEATVIHDEALSFVDASDNNSSILFWVKYPSSCSKTTVCLSGIAPGGFTGASHVIASLTFMPTQTGTSTISFSPFTILKHDGKGSAIPVSAPPIQLVIENALTGGIAPVTYTDTEAPEAFTPVVTSDVDVYDGAFVLIFETKDKQTKIVSYRVKEYQHRLLAWFSPWEKASSPYKLHDQSLQSYIAVVAIDEAGNERVMVVPPKVPYGIPTIYIMSVFLVFLCMFIGIFFFRRT